MKGFNCEIIQIRRDSILKGVFSEIIMFWTDFTYEGIQFEGIQFWRDSIWKGFNFEGIQFWKDSIWKGFNPKGIDLKGKVESESRLGIHFFRPFFFSFCLGVTHCCVQQLSATCRYNNRPRKLSESMYMCVAWYNLRVL